MSTLDIARLSQKILSELKVETWFENETTSTNSIAKEQAAQLSVPLKVYLTNHQSAGRGRNENTWTDLGSGSVFLSSWSFSFRRSPQPILAPLVGLSLYRNLAKAFGDLSLSLKAPNDILLGNNKLCGILIENILNGANGRCIIGIGLNVLSSPQELNATHLAEHTDVTEARWRGFIAGLSTDLAACIVSSESDELTPKACLELTQALQKNPFLDEPLEKVSPKGSLVFKNRTIDWQML